MNDFINHPVFICGHPKAGTSLVTALLDGHPNILVYPEETLFFRRFLPAIQGKNFDEKIDLARKLLIQMFEWNQENPPEHQQNFPDRDYSHIPFDDVYQHLVDALPNQHLQAADFLNAAILAFGKASNSLAPNRQFWVEKSPYNEFYTDKIFSWWPKTKCIHIIRDPRDNFISYERKHPEWTAKVFTTNWMRSSRAGIENLNKFGKERYYILRFEDLLTDPEKTTMEIAEFLQISWDNALLEPTRVGDGWQGNSMFAEKYQSISTAPIGRWKELIDPYDLEIIQIIGDDVMRFFEYDPVSVDYTVMNWKQKIKLFREKLVKKLQDI
jgi:hypothetical protein